MIYTWIHIRVPPGGDVVVIISQSHLFSLNISIFYFFIYWRGVIFCFLAMLYTVAWSTILLDDCWIPYARRTNIGWSVLISCTLIVTSVQYFIILMSSALYPEDTSMRETHSWVLVTNPTWLRRTAPDHVDIGHLKDVSGFHQYWFHVVRLRNSVPYFRI